MNKAESEPPTYSAGTDPDAYPSTAEFALSVWHRVPNSFVENLPPAPGERIKTRLKVVYDLAAATAHAKFPHTAVNLLDVGTYDGFGVLHLLERLPLARILSFDIDQEKIDEALANPDLRLHIKAGQLQLQTMDATAMQVPENFFHVATIVEVLGAGFEGEAADVYQVFHGVSRSLRAGGYAVFTMKNEAAAEVLPRFPDAKGVPLDPETLRDYLISHGLFESVEMSGQYFLKRGSEGLYLPHLDFQEGDSSKGIVIAQEAFDIRPADPKVECPVYWVGIAQKACE